MDREANTAAANLADEAHAEAVRRYGQSGDVEGALIFYRLATSFPGKITDADVSWARKAMLNHGR